MLLQRQDTCIWLARALRNENFNHFWSDIFVGLTSTWVTREDELVKKRSRVSCWLENILAVHVVIVDGFEELTIFVSHDMFEKFKSHRKQMTKSSLLSV